MTTNTNAGTPTSQSKPMPATGKSPALAALIAKKLFGKKKMAAPAVKVKTTPIMPAKTAMAPKGIAIGNPNVM